MNSWNRAVRSLNNRYNIEIIQYCELKTYQSTYTRIYTIEHELGLHNTFRQQPKYIEIDLRLQEQVFSVTELRNKTRVVYSRQPKVNMNNLKRDQIRVTRAHRFFCFTLNTNLWSFHTHRHEQIRTKSLIWWFECFFNSYSVN